MTVVELIAELNKYPPNTEVYSSHYNDPSNLAAIKHVFTDQDDDVVVSFYDEEKFYET